MLLLQVYPVLPPKTSTPGVIMPFKDNNMTLAVPEVELSDKRVQVT